MLHANTDISTVTSGLASLVWWDFHNVQITPSDLRSRVAAAGFDPSTVSDIEPTDAVRQAVRSFRIHNAGRVVMEAAVAHEDHTAMVINLLTLTQQARERVAKLPTDELVWDKIGRVWLSVGLTAEAATLRNEAAELMSFYDGNKVREHLVMPAIEESKAFTLKRGMYVVPHATAAPIERVAAALADLETFKLRVAVVTPNQGWEAPLADASRAELRNDLQELQEQINGWKSMAKRVRCDTVETVMARFASISERAALYREALAISIEDIEAEVLDMKNMAEAIINDTAPAPRKEAPAPAPVTPQQARRAALRAMNDDQLNTLWDALGNGEQPAEREALVEAIASAMEASR
jgi:hypothetical protein